MADVFMSKEATEDLEQIGDYIAHQFKSPKSAHNTILKIKERIEVLEDFPQMGTPLSAIVATYTELPFSRLRKLSGILSSYRWRCIY